MVKEIVVVVAAAAVVVPATDVVTIGGKGITPVLRLGYGFGLHLCKD